MAAAPPGQGGAVPFAGFCGLAREIAGQSCENGENKVIGTYTFSNFPLWLLALFHDRLPVCHSLNADRVQSRNNPMAGKADMPVFTGSELALADALVLIMDVLVLHGIMKSDALDSVFVFLEERYHANGLKSSAAMAQYLRDHISHPDQASARSRLRALLDEPEGSA
jgi:hypothetical protein